MEKLSRNPENAIILHLFLSFQRSFRPAAFKFGFQTTKGGMQSACSLGHPLVAYYIIQICSEKNTGLNFKGDEEVGEQFRPRPCLRHF